MTQCWPMKSCIRSTKIAWSRTTMLKGNGRVIKFCAVMATTLGVCAAAYHHDPRKLNDIPNRIPEAAPYVLAEAQAFPPPYHQHWEQEDSPGIRLGISFNFLGS